MFFPQDEGQESAPKDSGWSVDVEGVFLIRFEATDLRDYRGYVLGGCVLERGGRDDKCRAYDSYWLHLLAELRVPWVET